MENRTVIISVRVNPQLLSDVKTKLDKEYETRYANSSNKRFVKKITIADMLECAMVDYLNS